jgi:hypothetical protein
LPSNERNSINVKITPRRDIIGHKSAGIEVAPLPVVDDSRAKTAGTNDGVISPISNAPVLNIPEDLDLPDRYQFEVYRLRNRITELETVVLEKDDKLRHALVMLDDELLFWRTGLHCHVWETMGRIINRVVRLESAIARIRDKSSKFTSPLDLPARWLKGER